jgi:hypothetical protein
VTESLITQHAAASHSSHHNSSSWCCSSSSSGSSSDDSDSGDDHASLSHTQQTAADLASTVLGACVRMLVAPTVVQQALFTPAAAALPAMAFAVAALKYTDCMLLQQQQRRLSGEVLRTLHGVGAVALNMVNCIRLLVVPELMPYSKDSIHAANLALSVLTVVTVHQQSMQTLTSAHNTTSSSSSSGNSGTTCSSTSNRIAPEEAWDLVLQHEQQLPTFHPRPFDVLGLSQRLLAWLAACHFSEYH